MLDRRTRREAAADAGDELPTDDRPEHLKRAEGGKKRGEQHVVRGTTIAQIKRRIRWN